MLIAASGATGNLQWSCCTVSFIHRKNVCNKICHDDSNPDKTIFDGNSRDYGKIFMFQVLTAIVAVITAEIVEARLCSI